MLTLIRHRPVTAPNPEKKDNIEIESSDEDTVQGFPPEENSAQETPH